MAGSRTTGILGQTVMVHGWNWTIWSEAQGAGCYSAFRRTAPVMDEDGTEVTPAKTLWLTVKREAGAGAIGRDKWKEAPHT